jgi:hypothetical protein
MLLECKNTYNKITSNPDGKYYQYLTFSDLKSLINDKDNINLVAIKTPQNTKLEIPDVKYTKDLYKKAKEDIESGKEEMDINLLESLSMEHQLYIEAEQGEISVYLILTKDEKEELLGNPYNNNEEYSITFNAGGGFVSRQNRKFSFSSWNSSNDKTQKNYFNNNSDMNIMYNSTYNFDN